MWMVTESVFQNWGIDLGSVDKIVTKVKSHGVKLYKLSKKQV